mmetsp:Transcript_3961/g.4380  ORF Transcript_3961/g.4380 Transcript_3961/m.4380 type:complete len:280 (-) Transcript_3961:345-1184(-)
MYREYGIRYDKNIQEIDEGDIRASGRYFLGVGETFIIYPRRYQSFEFANFDDAESEKLFCWTSNGQQVNLEVSFYFRLAKDKLPDFYYQYGSNWEGPFIRYAIGAIKDTTTDFQTTQFFEEREKIKQALLNAVTAVYKVRSNDAIEIKYFQLRRVEIPPVFENAIVKKLVQLQAKRTFEIRQESEQITAETDEVRTITENEIRVIKAEAEAEGLKITTQAEAQAFKDELVQEATSYKKLKDELNLQTDSNLLHFIWAQALGTTSASKMVGLNNPLISID